MFLSLSMGELNNIIKWKLAEDKLRIRIVKEDEFIVGKCKEIELKSLEFNLYRNIMFWRKD